MQIAFPAHPTAVLDTEAINWFLVEAVCEEILRDVQ